mgnify:CR=1 FL=1
MQIIIKYWVAKKTVLERSDKRYLARFETGAASERLGWIADICMKINWRGIWNEMLVSTIYFLPFFSNIFRESLELELYSMRRDGSWAPWLVIHAWIHEKQAGLNEVCFMSHQLAEKSARVVKSKKKIKKNETPFFTTCETRPETDP